MSLQLYVCPTCNWSECECDQSTGAIIRRARKRSGLTFFDAAHILGVSAVQLSNYERNVVTPLSPTVAELVAALAANTKEKTQ